MILAAGLGTRLRPLTEKIPKALVEIQDFSLLELMIRKLKYHGFNEIIVNVHHFADQIINFIEYNDHFNIRIEISDERDQLLDTGGAVKKASWFFGDLPFLLINVDVITDLDFNRLYEFHKQSALLATLAVRNRESGRYLLFNEDGFLCGWENIKTKDQIICNENYQVLNELAFSGIHVISPEIFDLMHENGKFPIIDVYLRLAKQHEIKGYLHNSGYWADAGSPQKVDEINYFCETHKILKDITGNK